MDYISINIKPYIKSHLELKREITLIEMAPSPYFFVKSICLANMFAKFDEIPAMTRQDNKETKHYGRTQDRTTWKQFTLHIQSLRGYNKTKITVYKFRTLVKSVYQKIIFLFLNKNIC